MIRNWIFAGAVILMIIVIASMASDAPKTPETPAPKLEAFYPEPSNYAVDAAGVLSVEQLTSLNSKLKGMDNQKHQFGVAIVKTTKPLDIEQYGIKLAEKWKVGKKGLDNGAIIIVATQDRKVRIEVGYGLEGDVNDAAAGKILNDNMVPILKQGDWNGAIVAGLDALAARIK